MIDAFLANTSTQGLSPLGTAPQRSFELITGTVRDTLSEAHAALFAEPVATQYGDRFDWYASVAGKPVPLSELDKDKRAAALARLDSLLEDIAAHGAELLQSPGSDAQRLGEALQNAIQYPDESCVYVLTEAGARPDEIQPVLVNWAWVSDTQKTVTGALSGTQNAARAARFAAAAAPVAAAAAPLPPPPAPLVQERTRAPLSVWWLMWLGWLLLLAMIIAILYLMIEACALRLPGLPNYCPPPGPEASAVLRDTAWLRDQIAIAERQIGIADRACQPQRAEIVPFPEMPAPPPAPAPEPQNEIDQRLAERGAETGDLTFTLIWDGLDDLDLHVQCPAGQTLFYGNRNACGGRLDVDSNAGGGGTSSPVENAFFNGPQRGTYNLRIHLFRDRSGRGTHPFQLRIKDGAHVETHRGVVSTGQTNWTHVYQMRGN